jgi:hypothetical protein
VKLEKRREKARSQNVTTEERLLSLSLLCNAVEWELGKVDEIKPINYAFPVLSRGGLGKDEERGTSFQF